MSGTTGMGRSTTARTAFCSMPASMGSCGRVGNTSYVSRGTDRSASRHRNVPIRMALDRSGAQVRVDPGATRRIFCADDCSPNLWRSRTLHSPARGHGSALNLKTGTKQHEFGTSLEPFRRPSVPWASVRVESRQIFKVLDGGRTRARTWDPLIKSELLIRSRFLHASANTRPAVRDCVMM